MDWTHVVDPDRPAQQTSELDALLRKATAWWFAATQEQKDEMMRKQRAEMNWPRDCPYR